MMQIVQGLVDESLDFVENGLVLELDDQSAGSQVLVGVRNGLQFLLEGLPVLFLNGDLVKDFIGKSVAQSPGNDLG
jgi:hypothetical protein